MKKHIILTILSVAAIFASCNNGFEPKPVLPEGNGLILSLDSRPMVTKADDAPVLPAYETAIDHFDFFFFDDEEGTTPTTGMHARVSGASTQLATGTGEAYAALMASISGKRWDKQVAEGLHQTEDLMAGEVAVWHLECLPDEGAARLCSETIRKA